jgi:DNA-directed RNA polymerase subunit RPC12/RpoP
MLLPIYKCPYCGAKIDPEGWGSYHGEYVGKASGKTYKYDKVSCGKCGRVVKEWK